MSQVADGLFYAHTRKVIRCDIKPSNIVLGKDGVPVMVDFGIAMMSSETNSLKPDSIRIGTPYYMSPEQIRREALDERTDIYAFGATFFKLLTGRVPFTQRTVHGLTYAHTYLDVPNPCSLREDIPSELADIILKCLAKDPSSRYSTMQELQNAYAYVDGYLTLNADLSALASEVASLRPLDVDDENRLTSENQANAEHR